MSLVTPRKAYYVCPKCGRIVIAPIKTRVKCKKDKTYFVMIRLDPFHLKIIADRIGGDLDIIPPYFFIRKEVDGMSVAVVAGFRLPIMMEEYGVYYVHPTVLDTFKKFVTEKYVEKKLVPEAKPPSPPSPVETLREVTEEVAERLGLGGSKPEEGSPEGLLTNVRREVRKKLIQMTEEEFKHHYPTIVEMLVKEGYPEDVVRKVLDEEISRLSSRLEKLGG